MKVWLKEEADKKAKEIYFKKGTIYSISRINASDGCPYEYYLSYIEKKKTDNNVYGVLGTAVHDSIEKICKGEKINFSDKLEESLKECEILDIFFPSDTIKKSWIAAMRNSVENFKSPSLWYDKPVTMDNEVRFLIELQENLYVQGYIDCIIYKEDNHIDIIDWKTSSRFSKSDLLHHGRQLVIYSLAMENAGYIIDNAEWYMLKYMVASWLLKNGNTKEKIVDRGKFVSEMQNDIKKKFAELKEHDEVYIELTMSQCIDNNEMEGLPPLVRDKYSFKPYIEKYEITEDLKQECIDYIKAKVWQIEENVDNPSWFEPKEIEKSNEFYCNVLCGHRNHCPFISEYNEKKNEEQDVIADMLLELNNMII